MMIEKKRIVLWLVLAAVFVLAAGPRAWLSRHTLVKTADAQPNCIGLYNGLRLNVCTWTYPDTNNWVCPGDAAIHLDTIILASGGSVVYANTWRKILTLSNQP